MNGKLVKLRKLNSNNRDADRSHSDLVSSLGFVRKIMPGRQETQQCYWQNIPRMIVETGKQEKTLRNRGIQASSLVDFLVQNSVLLTNEAKVKCHSPMDLFAEDQKP